MRLTILTASSGIGSGCAKAFAPNAKHINLVARQKEDVVALQKEILALNPNVTIDLVEYKLGDSLSKSLIHNTDVLIYTIGYLSATDGRKEEDDIDLIYDVNLKESVKVLEVFAQDMKCRKRGQMIVVSSVAGERGKASNKIYNSAKAGMSVYLDGLRQELFAFGVKVMTVKPGYVKTKMLGKLETPPILTADPDKLGRYIYKSYKRGRSVLYYKPIWRYMMWMIKHIPPRLYKRLKL